MAAHLASSVRARRGAYLAAALGTGVIAFALAGVSDAPNRVVPSTTTAPSVLGAQIVRSPLAGPALPATFEVPEREPEQPEPTAAPATTRRPTATTATPTTAPATTAPPSTEPPNTDPTLIPPSSTETDPRR